MLQTFLLFVLLNAIAFLLVLILHIEYSACPCHFAYDFFENLAYCFFKRFKRCQITREPTWDELRCSFGYLIDSKTMRLHVCDGYAVYIPHWPNSMEHGLSFWQVIAKLNEQEAILKDRIDCVMDSMLTFHFLESIDQSYRNLKRMETFVLIHKLNGVMHARHVMLKPTRVSMWKSLYRGLNGNVDLIKLIVDLALEA